jgi:DNA-binding response OmpR family regulator
MEQRPPDVIVLGPEWPERALLRAQLIEEGYEVVAVDAWPIPRLYRRSGMKPRVLLIDLHELPKPRETLDEVRVVVPAERVLIITALGSLTAKEVKGLGFNVIERPVTIGQIVAATGALLSRTPAEQSPHAMSSSRDE